MTATEQRVAIAEWLGWSCIEDNSKPLMMAEGSFVYGYPPEGTIVGNKVELPDFLNDLNAVNETELRLTDEQHLEFRERLSSLCEFIHPHRIDRFIVSATAPQRCEALLRCLGLWKD